MNELLAQGMTSAAADKIALCKGPVSDLSTEVKELFNGLVKDVDPAHPAIGPDFCRRRSPGAEPSVMTRRAEGAVACQH